MAKCKNWYINIERFGHGILHFLTPFSEFRNAFWPEGRFYFSVLYFKRGSLKSLILAVDDSLTKWM